MYCSQTGSWDDGVVQGVCSAFSLIQQCCGFALWLVGHDVFKGTVSRVIGFHFNAIPKVNPVPTVLLQARVTYCCNIFKIIIINFNSYGFG